MNEALLSFANYAFFVLHTGLVFFSMVGWAFRRTRVWQLVAMILTAASWFILGPLLYGIPGVCVCTVWHNQIRYELGLDPQLNFVQMIARDWLGAEMTVDTSEKIALSIFVLILMAMIGTWSYIIGYHRGQRAWQYAAPRDTITEHGSYSEPERVAQNSQVD